MPLIPAARAAGFGVFWSSATDPKRSVEKARILGEIMRLDSPILYAYSYAFASVAEYVLLDRREAKFRMTAIVALCVSVTLLNALTGVLVVGALIGANTDYDVWPILMIGYWVFLIGAYIVASKVYDNNIETIWERGNEMREDADRGPRWANRRSNAFLIANAAFFLAIFWILL